SSNSYFYDAAVKLYKKYNAEDKPIEGLNTIYKYAWKFGLGTDPDGKEKPSTGIEIAENFGSVYSFNKFKNMKIYYSRWELANALNSGIFDGTNVKFAPVDISKNDKDTEQLAEAKANLKKIVTDKLNLIGEKELVHDKDNIKKSIKEALEDIYNNSEVYKKSIDDFGKDKDTIISTTSGMITNWLIYSMPREIVSPVELANAAIGQGADALSPLQMTGFISTLANGGTRYKLHLVDKITDADGKLIEEFKPEVINKVKISKINLDTIKEGMRRCNSTGTAQDVFKTFPIPTAGKTGTATFGDGKNTEKNYGRTDFGVYETFAPVDNPKIAVVVAIYDGVHGYFGAPVAKAIYETYFRNEIKKDFPGYTTINPLSQQQYDYSLNPPLEKENGADKNLEKKNNTDEKVEN
ncbi:MAG: penicillin-binding transpeptidase domain-containing protein, partial [Sarcina sp.]